MKNGKRKLALTHIKAYSKYLSSKGEGHLNRAEQVEVQKQIRII